MTSSAPSTAADCVQTACGMAHPWLCDVMGHMNTRNIVALFDDAAFHLISLLGYSFSEDLKAGLGWADVNLEVQLRREIPIGTVLVVRSRIVKLGTKSFTGMHILTNVESGANHAVMTAVVVRLDRNTRKAISLPADFQVKAERFCDVQALPRIPT